MALKFKSGKRPAITVALAGNPNSGKSTLFNAITGSRQRVANYPGVTVEKRIGAATFNGKRLDLVDLPGTYSLSSHSLDERVARDFLVDSRPDVIVGVLDASNLERNLFLAVQLLEMGAPLVLALNMSDVAARRGVRIDVERLSRALGCPVVRTVASRGEGVGLLLAAVASTADRSRDWQPREIAYGDPIDRDVALLTEILEDNPLGKAVAPSRWLALKCLEQDEEILDLAHRDGAPGQKVMRIVAESAERLQALGPGNTPARQIAQARYDYIETVCRGAVERRGEDRPTLSDRIDRVATHPLLGFVVMAAVLYGVYWLTFTLSESQILRWAGLPGTPVGWVEGLFTWLASRAAAIIPPGLLQSLVVSGIIGGVGGVLGFVPIVFFMFLAIALIEDSGYMTRAALLLDRTMARFGLHGNSVLAMVVSGGLAGGCAVPGIMATRTLRDPKERVATILVCPFMNCGAKLPVYAMLIAAFFAGRGTLMMLLLTAISWTMALSAAWVLRKAMVQGPRAPFLMELPPYRLPTPPFLLIQATRRVTLYMRKAGTVILAASVLLWALMKFPQLPADPARIFDSPAQRAQAELAYSLAGRLGKGLSHLLAPIGFDWRTSVALVGGFAAKEVVVSTMGTAYSLGEVNEKDAAPLSDRLASDPHWSPLAAFSLLLFVMLYAPCVSTIAVIIQETRSWRWGLFSAVYSTGLAWLVCFVVYQGGRLLGIGV